jgi:hypothetical protein
MTSGSWHFAEKVAREEIFKIGVENREKEAA